MEVMKVEDLESQYLNAQIWQLKIRLAIMALKRKGASVDVKALEALEYRYSEVEQALFELINK